MTDPIVRIEHLRKEFSYTSPTPNASTDDMWLDYLLGLLGRRSGELAAQRKRTVAVDDVSLAVDKGEFFGLLGPNGAGKTTLIKMLATILRPNAGSIAINGHDTVRDTAQARACINVVQPRAGSPSTCSSRSPRTSSSGAVSAGWIGRRRQPGPTRR